LLVSAAVALRGVTKFFGSLEALRLIDLDVVPGEIVTLLGASGSGKTTLLRLIAGLEEPSAGHVTIDGGSPHDARVAKRIGWVPQSPALLPWRSVARNARLLLEVNRDATGDTARSTEDLLAEVGLAEFADAYPHELSGGMRQRVALVRAMALGAPLMLMDEPFAALDEITRADMRHLLARLCEQLATTVVFVTHSVPEAVYLSDRVVVLSTRPARIVGIEPIALARPRRADVEDEASFFALTKRLRLLLQGEPR
jgi:NitT/TauT family transport system ATP-binding protein